MGRPLASSISSLNDVSLLGVSSFSKVMLPFGFSRHPFTSHDAPLSPAAMLKGHGEVLDVGGSGPSLPSPARRTNH